MVDHSNQALNLLVGGKQEIKLLIGGPGHVRSLQGAEVGANIGQRRLQLVCHSGERNVHARVPSL